MRITVVIPCYNAERYVAMAIRSVQMQTFRNWRLIVVDDGSTDGSWAQIERALGSDLRCLGIRTDNHGVAAARNLAIDRAEDGLIVPLDADDWLYPDALYEFALAFSHIPGLRLAVPQDHRKGEGIDKIVAHTWHGYESLLKRNSLTNTCCFRRSDWFRVGGYREGTLYEDWEFWIRLLEGAENGQIFNIPKVLVEYTIHKDSRVHAALKRHKEEVDIIKQLNPNIYGKGKNELFQGVQVVRRLRQG